MSPVKTLLLAIALGVVGAAVVVIFQSAVADVVGGVVAIVALTAVTSSALRLASEIEPPDDEPA
jgi:uncharacterized protein (DUF697 family)